MSEIVSAFKELLKDRKIVRPTWKEYHMCSAILAATRSSSLKRHVGAVTIRGNRGVTGGYNGAPSGVESELDSGYCFYERIAFEEYLKQIGEGKKPDKKSIKDWARMFSNEVHAEENAFGQMSCLGGIGVDGCDLYITNYPCPRCSIQIVSNRIRKVFYWRNYKQSDSLSCDEKKASSETLGKGSVCIEKVTLSEERILEIAYMQLSVGLRTDYQFDWSVPDVIEGEK